MEEQYGNNYANFYIKIKIGKILYHTFGNFYKWYLPQFHKNVKDYTNTS